MVNQKKLYTINSYFSIIQDTLTIENCQSLYPTKFGYVSVLSYKRSGESISMDEMNAQLLEIIQIKSEYIYSEPEKKGISILHIALSLGIGLIVYGLIAYIPKFKKRT